MNEQSLLDRVNVAAPCKARWEDMTGDDRVRFCRHCEKNVFNLSALSREEAEELIRKKEGKFCGRLYRRRDGRVLTANCPEGRSGKRRRLTRWCGLLAAALFVAGSARKALNQDPAANAKSSRLVASLEEMSYQIRLKLGWTRPTPVLLGEIRVMPPPRPASGNNKSNQQTNSGH